MFAIGFAEAPLQFPYDDPNPPAAYGQLLLGEASPEGFLSSLAAWSKSDYQEHWRRELRALISGQPKATLIVDLPDLLFRATTEVWDAYLEGSNVYFQNRLLWGGNLPTGSAPAEISLHTPERTTTTEDDQRVSEWTVATEAIKTFLRAER